MYFSAENYDSQLEATKKQMFKAMIEQSGAKYDREDKDELPPHSNQPP